MIVMLSFVQQKMCSYTYTIPLGASSVNQFIVNGAVSDFIHLSFTTHVLLDLEESCS